MEPSEIGSSSRIETGLSRDLGLTSALAIGIGTMIAAGIFTLSGLAIRNVGSAAVLSFVMAAIVALFTALTYCEFVSIYPRSGEGYLYARKTFAPPLAYFVGWALFLGYASSCAFYIASLSSYFVEFVWHIPVESLPGIFILICLTLLNVKGTKESGSFQIVITAAKVVLLIWFVAGGISYVTMEEVVEKFSTDIVDIASTSALVFITFFGFSAIAASAGEVKNPVKTIPRAIFISMGVVTVLYTLVVLVTLVAGLTEYTEASMGTAAKRYLGPIGGMVIVAGAIFSMISASNASIMAGSRVTLSMSQLGHLPKEFGTINSRTRTPIVSLFIVGGAIMFFALLLPLEDLAHFANTVLLLALILVNIALIVHRKKFPDMVRPFRVPLVPLIPGLGILANFYLLTQILAHPVPFLMALGFLLLGIVGFLAWKGAQSEAESLPGEPSKVALGQFASDEKEKKFRILVPIANPATVEPLINLASALAKERSGVIVALRVVLIPRQMPLEYNSEYVEPERIMLEKARKLAESNGVNLTSLVMIAHNPAKAILETSRERHCNLIMMGWKGHTTSRQKILGEITDAVVTHARTDLMLVKFGKRDIKRILLPTAGGDHARSAEAYAANLAKGLNGDLTVCRVLTASDEAAKVEEKLGEAKHRIEAVNGFESSSKIIKSDDIAQGIINEGKNHDLVIVGATRDSIFQQILFGSIPENIAKNADTSVIMIKHYQPVKALLKRVMRD